MPHIAGGLARAVERNDLLTHELRLVESSIALLVGGDARRVTVSGLRYGERILPIAQSSAQAHGVVVRALWHELDDGCDIAVEPCG
jgi:hypothetical protein